MSIEDQKPVVTYEITIDDQTNTYPLCVKVKPNTQLYKVLKVWANTHKLQLLEWAFVVDSERIRPVDENNVPTTLTVKDYGIDDDIHIDALMHQIGGFR